MTTPNIEWLIGRLRAFSGTSLAPALMHQAADTLQSQAERVKALELDLDVQAGSIEAVQAVNMRQAERIKELDGDVEYLQKDINGMCNAIPDYHWSGGAAGLIAEGFAERDTLRAQLAEIAATDPVLVVEKEPDYWSGGHFHEGSKPYIKSTKVWRLPIGTQLFTRPMPVQSAEHCLWARNGHEPCQHVKPMQDVTELVEAVTCLLQLIRREAPQLSGKVMGFAETALSKYKGAK